PRGREPDGFNFLVIRSPRLFGRPFLSYLNAFLIVILAGVVLLRSRINLRRPLLFILLSLWVTLELSSLINNWISFQRDRRFWGKSPEEKRIMINPKDFYPFLKFADQQLPPKADLDISASGLYARSYADYYLYPRILKSGAPYFLVFDLKPSPPLLKKYAPWKKFREGAYILKLKTQKAKGKTNVNI
ncbi:hypothetical protein HZB08_01280, partial [Candidatus Saganbacteria bacterium]|nr:hypothetical protein [Candidatus Saganbacteria bacterium]